MQGCCLQLGCENEETIEFPTATTLKQDNPGATTLSTQLWPKELGASMRASIAFADACKGLVHKSIEDSKSKTTTATEGETSNSGRKRKKKKQQQDQ